MRRWAYCNQRSEYSSCRVRWGATITWLVRIMISTNQMVAMCRGPIGITDFSSEYSRCRVMWQCHQKGFFSPVKYPTWHTTLLRRRNNVTCPVTWLTMWHWHWLPSQACSGNSPRQMQSWRCLSVDSILDRRRRRWANLKPPAVNVSDIQFLIDAQQPFLLFLLWINNTWCGMVSTTACNARVRGWFPAVGLQVSWKTKIFLIRLLAEIQFHVDRRD